MSTRAGRWILVTGLLIFALYAVYPPMRVPVRRERIVEKEALDEEEARRHGVRVGELYEIERESEETWLSRLMYISLSDRDEDMRIVERRDDGTVVRERTEFVEGRINRGLDVAGGTELVYELVPDEDDEEADVDVGRVIDILRNRIDPQNIKEYIIQPAGANRILIQVPEATRAEVAALKERITRMGRLEFRIGLPHDEYPEKYERAAEGIVEEGYEKMRIPDDPEERFYLIEKEAQITGEYLHSVGVGRDRVGDPAVDFRFTPEGGRQFARITSRNEGMLLGAVLDGTLQSAPVIRSTIGERGQITGRFTQQEVEDLIAVLQAGSLPMNLDLLQETTVGPQLGQDSIRSGLTAILIAGVLVVLFMGGYYLFCGLVADAALLFNLVLLFGVLALLGAALTLPGLAGILLTVGMAVDANVLIFERIREEIKAGKSIQVALRNGYDKAYSTIMDANITTLLTAAILYMVGTGPVRGFAITLSVGIVLSLFTSLYVTRLVFETLIARGWLKSFRMSAFIGRPALSYTRVRRVGYVASLVVLVAGLGVFFGRGADMLDVDFTGGTLVHLRFAESVPADDVREALIDGGYPNPQVQGVGRTVAGGSREFRVRISGVGAERVREHINPGIVEKIGDLAAPEDVTVRADGRSIRVGLRRELDEMALRNVLAGEEGDPYLLEDVAVVRPEEDPPMEMYSLRVKDPGFRTLDDVIMDVLLVFGRLGARSSPVEVEPAEPDDDDFYVTVTTDRELDARVLKRALLDQILVAMDTEDVGVEMLDDAQTFAVRGAEREELEGTLFVPDVVIEEDTVTAELEEPVRRSGVARRAEMENILENVVIVSRGYASDSYVLELREEGVRETIEAIFAGRGLTAGVDVASRMEEAPEEPGKMLLSLELEEAVSDDTIRYRLREAGLEPGRYLMTELPPGATARHIQLRLPQERAEEMKDAAVASFADAGPVMQTTSIGSVVAGEMQARALLAIICASIIIVIYVAVRFHAVKFGVAAVIALLHDVAVTAGIIALADLTGVFGDVKINLPMLAAFLTIIGYSLNDTIVVFDRIRENTIQQGRKTLSGDIIDLSINQTLSRTVLTSLTTLSVVLILYLLGGPALQGLAFTLIVGVMVGTYSSVFIASPILLDWEPMMLGAGVFFKVLLFPVRAPFKLAGKLMG